MRSGRSAFDLYQTSKGGSAKLFIAGTSQRPRLNEPGLIILGLNVSDVERTAEVEAIRRKLIPLTAYRQLLNGPEHVSDWLAVDQSMIDTFADATHDHQFIHTDRQRAESETPFGGTIAHGFLTLSLLSALAFDAMPGVEGIRMGVNYGFERVRFLSPVKSGARVRGKFRLIGLTERAVSIQSTWDTVVEVEGMIKPAIEAHWITLALIDPDEPPVQSL
jgi:acyl dehydratase